MLDLNDFIAERGGDPKKIKENQRKRFAPEEAVDEVITLYEEARRGRDVACVKKIHSDLLKRGMRLAKSVLSSTPSLKKSERRRRYTSATPFALAPSLHCLRVSIGQRGRGRVDQPES